MDRWEDQERSGDGLFAFSWIHESMRETAWKGEISVTEVKAMLKLKQNILMKSIFETGS